MTTYFVVSGDQIQMRRAEPHICFFDKTIPVSYTNDQMKAFFKKIQQENNPMRVFDTLEDANKYRKACGIASEVYEDNSIINYDRPYMGHVIYEVEFLDGIDLDAYNTTEEIVRPSLIGHLDSELTALGLKHGPALRQIKQETLTGSSSDLFALFRAAGMNKAYLYPKCRYIPASMVSQLIAAYGDSDTLYNLAPQYKYSRYPNNVTEETLSDGTTQGTEGFTAKRVS